MEEVPSQTILQRIVTDSLTAFPEDAHLRVLNFFEARNISESSRTLLKGAWSRALLTHDAFGKGKKNALDKDVFFNDFISELLKHFTDADRFSKLSNTLRTASTELEQMNVSEHLDEHQEQKIDALIHTVDEARSYMLEYVKKVYGLPKEYLEVTQEESDQRLDAMIQYQEVMRKMKVSWKKVDMKGNFLKPVSKRVLFEHSYRVGKLVLGLDDLTDPPLFCSTTQVLGLDIPHDHSSAIDYCWNTFGFLHDALFTGYYNPFPKPITALRQEDTLNTIFCFEMPTGKKLPALVGADFGKLLRRYPAVVSMWARQLSLGAQALGALVGRAVNLPTLDSVVVRDDGLLLIGGMCFMEPGGTLKNDNVKFFTPLVYDILATALCLSRTVSVSLPLVDSFAHAGAGFDQLAPASAGEGEDGEERTGLGTYVLSAGGSALALRLSCGKVADSVIMDRSKAYVVDEGSGSLVRASELNHYYSILVVVTDWTPHVPTHAGSKIAEAGVPPKVSCQIVKDPADQCTYAMLKVTAQTAGQLKIECSSLIPQGGSITKAERRLSTLQIDIVMMPPAESVEVQELVGYIEERHVWQIDTAVYQSYLFRQARDFLNDSEKTNDLLMQCASAWKSLRKNMGADKEESPL
eukprot:gene34245-41452_t